MRNSKPAFDLKNFDSNKKIAIVVSKWNIDFNESMSSSAIETLEKAGIKKQNISKYYAPGAFELPLLAMHLAACDNYDAIICFGTILKGETLHFEIVAKESARGLMDVMLSSGIPVINGILACDNLEQAEARAAKDKENKGEELALSCLEILNNLAKIN